jgi:hypothetical protein
MILTLAQRAFTIKLLRPLIIPYSNMVVIVNVKYFLPSLIYAGKAGAYPRRAPYDPLLEGWLLAFPANIRLGWK